MVKVRLVSKMKNIFDWSRFLALETSTFLVHIYFFNLDVYLL